MRAAVEIPGEGLEKLSGANVQKAARIARSAALHRTYGGTPEELAELQEKLKRVVSGARKNIASARRARSLHPRNPVRRKARGKVLWDQSGYDASDLPKRVRGDMRTKLTQGLHSLADEVRVTGSGWGGLERGKKLLNENPQFWYLGRRPDFSKGKAVGDPLDLVPAVEAAQLKTGRRKWQNLPRGAQKVEVW